MCIYLPAVADEWWSLRQDAALEHRGRRWPCCVEIIVWDGGWSWWKPGWRLVTSIILTVARNELENKHVTAISAMATGFDVDSLELSCELILVVTWRQAVWWLWWCCVGCCVLPCSLRVGKHPQCYHNPRLHGDWKKQGGCAIMIRNRFFLPSGRLLMFSSLSEARREGTKITFEREFWVSLIIAFI